LLSQVGADFAEGGGVGEVGGFGVSGTVRHGHKVTSVTPVSQLPHCPHGHALTAPNIIAAFAHAGRRGYLACHRARGYVAYHPEADLRTEADRYYTEVMGCTA
jgi:hypothetical protein